MEVSSGGDCRHAGRAALVPLLVAMVFLYHWMGLQGSDGPRKLDSDAAVKVQASRSSSPTVAPAAVAAPLEPKWCLGSHDSLVGKWTEQPKGDSERKGASAEQLAGYRCASWFPGKSWYCARKGASEDSRVRASLRWQWVPETCSLFPWSPKSFLQLLSGRKLLLMGDSLTEEMWMSLHCMMHSIDLSPSHTVNSSYHTLRRLGVTEQMYKLLDKFDFFRDATGNAIAGMHHPTHNAYIHYLRSDFMLFPMFRLDQVPPAKWKEVTGQDKPSYSHLERAWRNILGVPEAGQSRRGMGPPPASRDIFVFNTGAHGSVQKNPAFWRRTAHLLNHLWPGTVIYRTVEYGHPGCEKTMRPLRPHEMPRSLWYNWASFPGLNKEIAQHFTQVFDAVAENKFRTLNITMFTERGDGHHVYMSFQKDPNGDPRGKCCDCLHYCLPGIPDMWNHMLFDLLAGLIAP